MLIALTACLFIVALGAFVLAIFTDSSARYDEQDPPEMSPIDDIGYDRGQS